MYVIGNATIITNTIGEAAFVAISKEGKFGDTLNSYVARPTGVPHLVENVRVCFSPGY